MRRPLALLVATLTTLVALLAVSPAATASPTPTPTPAPTPTPSARPASTTTGPTAEDDVLTVQAVGYYRYLRVPYAANDTAGSAPLKLSATRFSDDQPPGATVSEDRTLVDLGTLGYLYLIPDGTMQFLSYGPTGSGVVRYRITDAAGASSEATVTVVVGPGGVDASLTVRQGLQGTVDVLQGDIPGRDADGSAGTIDATSVHFTTYGQPAGSTVSVDGRTLTVANAATFRADPVTGLVTVVPEQMFSGPATVFYTARDTTRAADGTVQHHSYRLGIDLSVTPVRPKPVNDEGDTPFDASVTVPGVTNDHPGAPDVPLLPDLTVFTPPAAQGLPHGSSLFAGGRGLKVPGRGWWTLNSDHTITFTPARGFTGTTGYVRYTVQDAYHSTSQGNVQVFVETGPQAQPDTGSTTQNATVSVDVTRNDAAGRSAANNAYGSIDVTSVHFEAAGQPTGATVSVGGRSLTVPGQGVYSADRVTGLVTFDPVPAFAGTASPVRYSERDTVQRTSGAPVHNPTSATLTLTVRPVTPVALDDVATTDPGRAVQVPVLDNDAAGAGSAPLVASSLRMRLTPGLPAGSQLSTDATTLTVAGHGTFVARADGVVVFTPAVGATGPVPAVGYQVGDANGTVARASITVLVRGAAVLRPTTATTRAGQPVVVDVLSNDDPPFDAGWVPSSVCLVSGSTCVETLTRPGLGTWTVDASGQITVSPLASFVGQAQVTYSVRDTASRSYTSTLTTTVQAARQAKGD